MKKDYSKLWVLFKSMFVLSACTFGGGFVIVSLMKKKFVEELQWLEEDEMLDVTAITQSAPGPLPVNASVIIGYRIAGVIGSLTAILGTILPPMIIISIISLFYEQFRTNPYISTALQVMRAGVAAVIFDVVINLAGNVIKTKRILYISMMIIAFVATYLLDVSAMIIILACLGIGGYAAIPLIQEQIVNTYGLMTLEEFSDLITVAEMTPGPISINSATFVGMRIAGIPGVLLCSIGCIIPSFCICLILAHFYYKYRSVGGVQVVLGAMRPAVVSLIASAGASILMLGLFQAELREVVVGELRVVELGIFVVALFLLRKYKVSAIAIILGSGIVGTVIYALLGAI